MYCEKALELVKDLKRSMQSGGASLDACAAPCVSTFDEQRVRATLDEMHALFDANAQDAPIVQAQELDGVEEEASLRPSIHVRHVALERNKRCLLAYLYNRLLVLKQIRWQMSTCVLPDQVTPRPLQPPVSHNLLNTDEFVTACFE